MFQRFRLLMMLILTACLTQCFTLLIAPTVSTRQAVETRTYTVGPVSGIGVSSEGIFRFYFDDLGWFPPSKTCASVILPAPENFFECPDSFDERRQLKPLPLIGGQIFVSYRNSLLTGGRDANTYFVGTPKLPEGERHEAYVDADARVLHLSGSADCFAYRREKEQREFLFAGRCEDFPLRSGDPLKITSLFDKIAFVRSGAGAHYSVFQAVPPMNLEPPVQTALVELPPVQEEVGGYILPHAYAFIALAPVIDIVTLPVQAVVYLVWQLKGGLEGGPF
ncbi:MAG: hypothetical protein NXI24_17735 [bacterium]|nr:hypothetical protein [bacterium]